MTDPYTRGVILDAIRAGGPQTWPEIRRRVWLQRHNEAMLLRELRRLVRDGVVTRTVRRRFCGIQNSAFPSGASVLRREAIFAMARNEVTG